MVNVCANFWTVLFYSYVVFWLITTQNKGLSFNVTISAQDNEKLMGWKLKFNVSRAYKWEKLMTQRVVSIRMTKWFFIFLCEIFFVVGIDICKSKSSPIYEEIFSKLLPLFWNFFQFTVGAKSLATCLPF